MFCRLEGKQKVHPFRVYFWPAEMKSKKAVKIKATFRLLDEYFSYSFKEKIVLIFSRDIKMLNRKKLDPKFCLSPEPLTQGSEMLTVKRPLVYLSVFGNPL